MIDLERKQYIADVRVAFETESGKRVIEYLNKLYIQSSCLDSTPELTYYRLGQRELVQSILNIINDPRDVEDITKTLNYTNEEIF